MSSIGRRPSAPAVASGIDDASGRSNSTIVLPSTTYKSELPTPRRAPPVSHSMMPERRWPTEVPALPLGAREHRNDRPVFADFDAPHFVVGGGVAIFHLASARVVLCWHTRDKYWFLPKGRRDAGEESGAGAEREGYEESGFRNRLLPLPLEHRQPQAAAVTVPLNATEEDLTPLRPSQAHLCTEPVLTQLLPVTRHRQYLLQWYVAETISASDEALVGSAIARAAAARRVEERQVYVRPPPFPKGVTLRARIEQDLSPMDAGPEDGEGSRKASDAQADGPPDPETIGIAMDSSPQVPSSTTNALGMEGVPSMPESEARTGTHTVTVRGAQFDMSPAIMPGGWPATGRRWAANKEKVSTWTDNVEAAGGSPPLGALLGSPNPNMNTNMNIGAALSPDPNAFAGPDAAPAPLPASAPAAFHTPQPASGEWAAMHRPGSGTGVGLGIGAASASTSARKPSKPLPLPPLKELYVPPRHPNTGVDAEEALYTSELVPVEEAVRRLEGSGMERVVRLGWEAICRRWAEEEREAKTPLAMS